MAGLIIGFDNNNQIAADDDRTQVYGLSGNDTITSENYNEVLLVGGSGDDRLIMKGGSGSLSGGKGKDTFELNYSASQKLSAVIEDLEPANDKIIVNFDGNTAPQLTSEVKGNDVVWKDSNDYLNLTLKGVRDNDYYDGSIPYEVAVVLYYTNDFRDSQNLPLLTFSEGLMKGASIRAEEITSQGNLGLLTDHTRPDGTPYYTVLNNKYNYPGENLDGGATSSYEVVTEWLESPDHYKNIVDKDFKKIGIGYNEDDQDPSNLRFYWTQLFADSLNNPETVSTADLLTVTPQVNTVSRFIPVTGNAYDNTLDGATIQAQGGSVSIVNSGLMVSISGSANKDTIENSGSFVTIGAGAGDDSINLSESAVENFIRYAAGDGNDTVTGLTNEDVIIFSGGEYTPVTVGNDIIVAVGDGSIKLVDVIADGVQVDGTRSKLYILTEDDDNHSNTVDGATIQALGGNDTINNRASNIIIDGSAGNDTLNNNDGNNVSISGGAGDDSLYNRGSNVTLDGNAGREFIYNTTLASKVTINGGDDDDSIYNYGVNTAINGDAGDDFIDNYESNATISGGAGDDRIIINDADIINISVNGDSGDDFIRNYGESATLISGSGNDTISNYVNSVTMEGGADDDFLWNFGGDSVTIEGGGGNDTVENQGSLVSISGGAGNDLIQNSGSSVTITVGADNDIISLSADAQNVLINYSDGDGRNIVTGFNETSTLRIGDGTGTYSTREAGEHIAIDVGTGFIALMDAAYLTTVNIQGVEREAAGNEGMTMLTEDPDNYTNTLEGEIVWGLGGDDTLDNTANNVLIDGGADNDSLTNTGNNVTLDGSAGNDSFANTGDNVTLDGGAGNDSIQNSGNNLAVNGGAGADTVDNTGNKVTIDAGAGNDLINLSDDAKYNLIQYSAGDGSDTVWGFNEDDTLSISDTYSTQSSGNNLIVNVGTGSINLVDAATLAVPNIVYAPSQSEEETSLITLTEGDDTYSNTLEAAMILALGGNDYLSNHSDSVTALGGAGDDTISNEGSYVLVSDTSGNDEFYNSKSGLFVTLDGGAGNDTIGNSGNSSTILGGDDNDSIHNWGSSVSIDAGAGENRIFNHSAFVTITGGDDIDRISNYNGHSVTIDGGAGNDYFFNDDESDSVTINGGSGDDEVRSNASNASINVGDGNDTILSGGDNSTIIGDAGNDSLHNDGSNVLVDGGAGNDSIDNEGSLVTIDSGADNDLILNDASNVSITSGDGNDSIYSKGSNIFITGGAGNDLISLSSYSQSNLIQYNVGDGNDTIWGLSEDSSLRIGDGTETYSTVVSGGDVIINVSTGSIRLVDARDKPPHVIIGESGTSEGSSNSNSNSNSSSSGRGDGGGRGNGGGRTSGGTSSNEGRGSDASGGRSASGSAGVSSDSSGGSSGRVSSNRKNATASAATRNLYNDMTATQQTTNQLLTPTSSLQTVYVGGNQVISNYQSGEKIIFGADYTGAFYDGSGNFFAGSSTGALVVENALDKVIDLSDAAGNDFVKAYAATTAGVIDGRNIAGFELINGSSGADVIFAGDGGSQLWGGADVSQDILVGGNGADVFIGGRTQGADLIVNASSVDTVHLNDATLSDIIATEENNGVVAVAFNTGNVVAVQSSELLSAKFLLNDGSAYRFNHAAKNWQSA